MEFADYPKYLRDEWRDIQESWNRAMDRRGRRRAEAIDEVRDWMMGKLAGLHERNKRDREYWEVESWKSDEYKRAERLEESVCKLEDKVYEQQMEILALKTEILARKREIQLEAGVNLQKASPGLN